MGQVEDAVDAGAQLVGPFLDQTTAADSIQTDPRQLVESALQCFLEINAADLKADPNAPYDAPLASVVYGLLDMITTYGIIPRLSKGVAFRQRPRTILRVQIPMSFEQNDKDLSRIVESLIPILEQKGGTGVHSLLSERSLPDVLSGIAELAFSPRTTQEYHIAYQPKFEHLLETSNTSRLLPLLTSYLQQELPSWLRIRLSKERAFVPLRPHGVRHTVEFLALSYLSKTSQLPPEAGGSLSQIPIPLDAITKASKLIGSVPNEMDSNEWFTRLAPQLLGLLDGSDGHDLSKAAGHIIAAGILNRRTTGAPGAIGWELFARPLLDAINPKGDDRRTQHDQVLVEEQDLNLALKRLSAMVATYSHSGLIRRIVTPLLLPLWGLLWYGKSRPGLDAEWRQLPRAIVLRYLNTACEPKQIDVLATNLFFDGDRDWIFAPGSHGGVEIRKRAQEETQTVGVEGLLSRISKVDERVGTLVSMMAEARIDDEFIGEIFVNTTERWLSAEAVGDSSKSLLTEDDSNPLNALADAKLSEAMANKFKDKFARSPQHILGLMTQLIQNFVRAHRAMSDAKARSGKPSRAMLGGIISDASQAATASVNADTEDLVSFAISLLSTLVASPDYKPATPIGEQYPDLLPSFNYIVEAQRSGSVSPQLTNAASNILQYLSPTKAVPSKTTDLQANHRATLKTALTELTDPEPPNRAWALSQLRVLINDPTAFPIVDIPSTTHIILNASIADPESYVHTAAIPVLVDLTTRAPNPTLRILVDAFIDIDERSLKLKKEADIVQALDFRLRVGENLDGIVGAEQFWLAQGRFEHIRMIVEACLNLAGRRGNRKATQTRRNELLDIERKVQEEGEAAWGGPIPNLLDPEGLEGAEQPERDALFKIIQGWEETGVEEDVRVRSSALSILSVVMEKRLELMSQAMVDASLQMVTQILIVESVTEKAILRRAAVLVVMGLLRGLDTLLEAGKESSAGLGVKQAQEVERVMKWISDEDCDDMVKSHAETVIDGLETWRMKKLFKVGDERMRLDANLGLEGNLRGLSVQPAVEEQTPGRRGFVIEEIE